MRKKLVRKALEMFKKLSEDDEKYAHMARRLSS